MRSLMQGVLLLSLAGGCFGSHGGDDGDATDPDRWADGGFLCESFGRTRTCRDRCPELGLDACVAGQFCDHLLDVCVDGDAATDLTRSARNPDGEVMDYCSDGLLGVVPVEPPPIATRTGTCVDPAFCAELQRTDADFECVYSDRSDFVDGPPSACPGEVPNEFSRYCGVDCGGCDPFPVPYMEVRSACVGVNEERGFGLCVFGAERVCDRGGRDEHERFERLETLTEGRFGRVVCMTQRSVDGTEPDFGWLAFESGCRAYRERFGEAIDCRDADWRSIE